MAKRFTADEQSQARRLRAEGKRLQDIAKVMGRSLSGVWVQVTEIKKASVASDPWQPRPDRLQDHEREKIAVGLGRGESLTSIAKELGQPLDGHPRGRRQRRPAALPGL